MQPENKTACTVAEFCKKYAIHRSTFYRNAKHGTMPPVVKLGTATRILADDERAWLLAKRKPS